MIVYFVGVFFIDLVLDFIPAQFVEFMRGNLDEIGNGGLDVLISRKTSRLPQ